MTALRLLPESPPAAYAEAHAIDEINAIEQRADESESEASDLRWRQAERVVELLDDGWTQQQIADAWHRADGSTYSQPHVALVAKTWRYYLGNTGDRPRWNDAYHSPEVREARPKPQPAGEPPAKSRRKPIADLVGAAAHDVSKFSERIASIVTDERFAREKNELAAPLRNQLAQAIEAMQRLLAQLDPEGPES